MAHIMIRFDGDALVGTDETLDVDGSVEAFTDALRWAAHEAFPNHTADVTEEIGLVSPVLVDISGAVDHDMEDEIRFEVAAIAQRLWNDGDAWKVQLPGD